MPSSPPQLELRIHAGAGKEYVPFLRKYVIAAHGILRPRVRELSLALVGDARMSKLHQEFMKMAGPTDVLTFPLELDKKGRAISGEVVVCVGEAKRQARQRGTRIGDELLLYAIHGMLHLHGLDDRTQKDYRRMHRTEDQVLTQLGIGAIFAPDMARKAAEGRR
jgi:probable rRNA maturation factor